jgi:hypothetical protein
MLLMTLCVARRKCVVVSSFLLILSCAAAQKPPSASFDPRVTFAPLSLLDPVNANRSGNGAPGPQYWQNEADYELHAKLDTTAKELHATEVVTYTNNSPDTLLRACGCSWNRTCIGRTRAGTRFWVA